MNTPARISIRNARFLASLPFLLYGIALLALIDIKPLWLDELLQLEGTCDRNAHRLIQYVMQNAGGAPLGYLTQHWLLSFAGCSTRSARVLSVFSGVGSIVLLRMLGTKLRLAQSTVAIAIALWIVCPLVFRYSLEGRPYMQAMFFALAAAVAQIELNHTRSVSWAMVLAGCLAAAIYSQPFAVFGPLGFSLCSIWQKRESRSAMLTCGAYAIAVCSFAPWLLMARGQWTDSISHSQSAFSWNVSLVSVLFRECVGDGYPAGVPAVMLGGYTVWEILQKRFGDPRLPLAAAVGSSVLLALLGDASFHYFFAIRQVIYMIPFLLLMIADAVRSLSARPKYRIAAALLISLFIGAGIHKNYKHLSDRHEDWSMFSARLLDATQGGCIFLPSGDNVWKYSFFRSDFAHDLCDANLSARRVIVPRHSYTDARAWLLAEQTLREKGLTRLSSEEVGFGRIAVFVRSAQ